MTKSELIAKLAARYPQLVAMEAVAAVAAILDAMTSSRAKGERTGCTPKTGENVSVPQKCVPHFKPGRELKERVDK